MPAFHAGLAIATSLAIGCTVDVATRDPGGPSSRPGGPDAGPAAPGLDAAPGVDPQAMFTEEIDPLFTRARPKGNCVGCHQGATPTIGPVFLGPDGTSHYATLVGDGRLIGATPEASLLFTKGDHPSGNGFCTGADTPYEGCEEDETALLADWILAEAAN